MKVMVNGVVKELEYIVASGCDMAKDIIGNYEELECDEDGRLIMNESQYEWWTDEIDKLIEIDELIENLEIKDELFNQYTMETNGCDIETQTDMQLAWLKDYRKNH